MSQSLADCLTSLPSGSSVYQARYMRREDLNSVLAIESLCFETPWDSRDFVSALQARERISYVIEELTTQGSYTHAEVVGYLVYESFSNCFQILNVAVHPKHQRKGIGSALVRILKRRVAVGLPAIAYVRESNIDALNFLKTHRFFASRTVKNYWADHEDDAIVMRLDQDDVRR